MSDFDTHPEEASRSRLARGSREPTVQWIRFETAVYLPAPAPKAEQRRSENTTAMIVIGLTLACTLLAIFDLFQLAAGF